MVEKSIDFARRLLGEPLSELLLAGLGETKRMRRRSFTAYGISPNKDQGRYEFEIVGDSQLGLPRANDPVVFSALLYRLWDKQAEDGKIFFQFAELIKELRWPPNNQSRLAIRRAIERYSSTAYYKVDTELSAATSIYDHYRRLLIAYGNTTVGLPIKRAAGQKKMFVQFYPEFLNDIASERKNFLNVDFKSIHVVSRVL